MFQGSMPRQVTAMVLEHARRWPDGTELWVPCAGNFTIERTLAHLGRPMHSDDVNVYTCIIGSWLAGQPMDIEFAPRTLTLFPWLAGQLGVSPEQDVAVMMLCSAFAAAFKKPDHAYWARIADGYRDQWPDLLDKGVKKLVDAKAGVTLASFSAEDAYTWVDKIPADASVVSFPPFWEGGYTAMFKPLDEAFEWPRPEFEELDEARIDHVLHAITDRENWVLGAGGPIARLDDAGQRVGHTRISARGKEVFVYAGDGPRRTVPHRGSTTPILIPRLGEDETLRRDADIALVPLTDKQLAHAQSMYLSREINPGKVTGQGQAVVVDGVMVGVFAISTGSTVAHWEKHVPVPSGYLMTDFPVAPTKYRRLAKLIVTAALSREAQVAAEQFANRRVRSLVTTAFSRHHESMKYRGLLRLLSKAERTDGHPGWALNYGAVTGEWTLADGYRAWWDKHAKITEDPS